MGLDPIFARIVNCLGFFVAISSSLLVLFGPKAYLLYELHGSLMKIATFVVSSNRLHQAVLEDSHTHSAWRAKPSQVQVCVSPLVTNCRPAGDVHNEEVDSVHRNLVVPY